MSDDADLEARETIKLDAGQYFDLHCEGLVVGFVANAGVALFREPRTILLVQSLQACVAAGTMDLRSKADEERWETLRPWYHQYDRERPLEVTEHVSLVTMVTSARISGEMNEDQYVVWMTNLSAVEPQQASA